jgi:hypothetical protein
MPIGASPDFISILPITTPDSKEMCRFCAYQCPFPQRHSISSSPHHRRHLIFRAAYAQLQKAGSPSSITARLLSTTESTAPHDSSSMVQSILLWSAPSWCLGHSSWSELRDAVPFLSLSVPFFGHEPCKLETSHKTELCDVGFIAKQSTPLTASTVPGIREQKLINNLGYTEVKVEASSAVRNAFFEPIVLMSRHHPTTNAPL